MKINRGMLVLVWWAAAAAHAGPRARLRNPNYGGTGCPAGSVTTVESPDGATVTVLFDSFSAEAGGASGQKLARAYCDFSLPFQVPEGMRMGIVKIDYRGFNSLPSQARALLAVDYGLGRVRGSHFERLFRQGAPDIYTVTDRIGAAALRWTACGESAEISGRATLTVETNRALESALTTLDTIDGARGGVVYEVAFRPCARGER